MQNGAEAMVESLRIEGVKLLFGYPGAAIMPFYHALSQSKIRHILVRQEQHAGHAASGYARITGKPAVCVATSGPGAVNLMTALSTAYMDSIPLIALTGQVSSELLGRDVFQEADITGAVEPFTKHCYLIKSAEEIGRTVKEAFHIAGTGRPGPVLIDFPIDVQKQMVDFHYPDRIDIPGYKPSIKGHAVQIKRVVESLRHAKKPLVLAGGGIFSANAGEELLRFCEGYSIPAVTTMMGKGLFPENHPLFFGMPGSYGSNVANRALAMCDLLIVIGARVGDRAVTSPGMISQNRTIVHIDIDPAEIGKNVGTAIPLVGDAKIVLTKLLDYAHPTESAEFLTQLNEIRREAVWDFQPRNNAVNPRNLMRELSAQLPEGCVAVSDVGQNQIWAANHLYPKKARFLNSGGMGTMGYSLGAAVGAQLASGDATVIALLGDGAFQMNFMELATIVSQNLPIKIILFDNHTLGMIGELERGVFEAPYSISLDGSPDFLKLAESYGIPAARLDSEEKMSEAVAKMLRQKGPYLLICSVRPDESSL